MGVFRQHYQEVDLVFGITPGITPEMPPRKAEQVAKLRKEVEQLQREVEITRKPLSETIQDLLDYVQNNIKDEFLLRRDGKLMSQIEMKENHFESPKKLPCTVI